MALPAQVEITRQLDNTLPKTNPDITHSSSEDAQESFEKRDEREAVLEDAVSDESTANTSGSADGSESSSEHQTETNDLKDINDVWSIETHEAVERLYKYLQTYITGDLHEAGPAHGFVGLGADVMRRHERSLPLESRIKQNDIFSFMIQSYFRLVDDRLLALESKLPVENTEPAEGKGGNEEAAAENTVEGAIPEESRATWDDFKRKYDKRPTEVHALDVLIGDAIIPHNIWARFHSRDAIHLRDIRRGFSRIFLDLEVKRTPLMPQLQQTQPSLRKASIRPSRIEFGLMEGHY